MRTISRLFAALMAVALLAGCGDTAGGDVAATVDGTTISRDMLEASVVAIVGDTSEMGAEEREAEVSTYQRQFLGFFIQDLIYARALADAGVELSEDDIIAARDAEVEALGGQDGYQEQLAEYGVTIELFEVLVRLDTRTAALQRHVLDEEPARGVRHILVETEEEALDVLAELEGGADFGELAADRSTDPGSAGNGGEYPPAPRGQWVPEFDEAVWAADLNEVVGPVETVHGFHVIEVLSETQLDADDMAPQQLQQLTAQAVGQILEAAFEAADVTVAAGLGEWDPTSRQVVPTGSQVGVAPDGSQQPLPQE